MKNIPLEDRIIVALDVPTIDLAKNIVKTLMTKVRFFKVGLQLFLAGHFEIVDWIADQGLKVFLDLKLHDIPNTVKNAISQINNHKVFFTTVHSERSILKTAVEASKGVNILAVTVLTSMDKKDLEPLFKDSELTLEDLVLHRAMMAKEAGCQGIVASGREVSIIRKHLGYDTIVVTPGIRLDRSGGIDDQKRIVTPYEAIREGADYLVVGRPIIDSPSPEKTVEKILADISLGLEHAKN